MSEKRRKRFIGRPPAGGSSRPCTWSRTGIS